MGTAKLWRWDGRLLKVRTFSRWMRDIARRLCSVGSLWRVKSEWWHPKLRRGLGVNAIWPSCACVVIGICKNQREPLHVDVQWRSLECWDLVFKCPGWRWQLCPPVCYTCQCVPLLQLGSYFKLPMCLSPCHWTDAGPPIGPMCTRKWAVML